MAEAKYEPVVVGAGEVRAFAERAAAFCATLSADERHMWQTVIARAGAPSEALDAGGLAKAFAALWEDGTQIAPLYSGAMPEVGFTD
jgi:hypothetical protein